MKNPKILISIIVLFVVVAALIPTLTASGDDLQADAQCAASGYIWNSSTEDCRIENITGTVTEEYAHSSLAGLFSSDTGLILLLLLAGLMIFVYKKMKTDGK